MSLLRALLPSARLLRSHGPIRVVAGLGLLALAASAGCVREDVGAPCNHGPLSEVTPPLVTFPAVSCDELLCVYADATEAPDQACTQASDCSSSPLDADKFECVSGLCELRIQHVLDRSMCSKPCSDDGDCKDESKTKTVVAEGSACKSGFSCKRLQELGPFCCQKVCVCNDDYVGGNKAEDLETNCDAGQQRGCCLDSNNNAVIPVPEGCGM